MTTPLETMEWLDLQFRARANEDGEAHTAQDADQVEAARRAFGAMLPALIVAESFMSGFEGDETQEGIAGNLATIRAAIAAAEGREG